MARRPEGGDRGGREQGARQPLKRSGTSSAPAILTWYRGADGVPRTRQTRGEFGAGTARGVVRGHVDGLGRGRGPRRPSPGRPSLRRRPSRPARPGRPPRRRPHRPGRGRADPVPARRRGGPRALRLDRHHALGAPTLACPGSGAVPGRRRPPPARARERSRRHRPRARPPGCRPRLRRTTGRGRLRPPRPGRRPAPGPMATRPLGHRRGAPGRAVRDASPRRHRPPDGAGPSRRRPALRPGAAGTAHRRGRAPAVHRPRATLRERGRSPLTGGPVRRRAHRTAHPGGRGDRRRPARSPARMAFPGPGHRPGTTAVRPARARTRGPPSRPPPLDPGVLGALDHRPRSATAPGTGVVGRGRRLAARGRGLHRPGRPAPGRAPLPRPGPGARRPGPGPAHHGHLRSAGLRRDPRRPTGRRRFLRGAARVERT